MSKKSESELELNKELESNTASEGDTQSDIVTDNKEYIDLEEESPKKRKRLRKQVVTTLLTILGLVAILFVGGYFYANYLLGHMEKEKISQNNQDLGIGKQSSLYNPSAAYSTDSSNSSASSASDPVAEPAPIDETAELEKLPFFYEGVTGITNIALFGIDADEGTTGRSDAIMILTVDTRSNKIKISSIVRDSYVYIPGRGMDKINHAYAFGGAQLALKTINTNFHLDIRSYITVNFTSLPQIIDKVGGVDIVITEKEAALVPGIDKAGTYLLTGSQALAFARIRYIDSDFERSRRQRDVVESAIKKMFTQPLTSYPGLIKEVFPLLKTNMASNDMLKLGTDTFLNNIRTIEKMRYPTAVLGNGKMINGQYFFVFNRSQTLLDMGRYIYLDQK